MNNITVIGIGKLGLGFALTLEKIGYNVIGVDINLDYINSLNTKTFSSNEPYFNEYIQNSQNFKATTDLSEGLNHSNLIFIIVQTPNGGGEKFYDHSILSNLLTKINRLKPENKDLIIGCTVMPKYIDEIAKGLILDCHNCHISYNPEFVAQGDIIKGFQNPDIILFGTENENIKPQIIEIYSKMSTTKPKFCFMNPLEAEIVKISLNGFITTKISYANMISDLCDNLKADKKTVLDAIGNDSRIGTKYFSPGYSFGGPCFPRDTLALKQIMDQNNIDSTILYGTTLYNKIHNEIFARKLLEENKNVYIFENVCYKENSKISMIEESAKLKIAKLVSKAGKRVIIRDNEELVNEVKKEYGNIFEYEIM